MANHSPDVLIIGGGVAGLSAAVELSSKGHSVLLIEQKQHLGGRTYSFIHPETGDEVDNGQHLMMGCYTATLKYLKTIKALDTLAIQKNLSIIFRKEANRNITLKAAPLPAPLNVLAGLLRLRTLPFSDRLLLIRVGIDLMLKNPDTNQHLHSFSVDQWLDELHQTEKSKKYLWDIIAVGALNDSTEKISAALFAKVLKTAFFGKRKNSSLAFPKYGLTKVVVQPAAEFILQQNGKILLNTGISRIEQSNAKIESVILDNGESVRPSAVISAVPYFDISKIFGSGSAIGVNRIDQFVSSPIVTLHLWFDAHFIKEECVALLDSPLHWVFNKSKIYARENEGLMYLSIVISGADALVGETKETLAAMAHHELKRLYPAAAVAKIIHSLVIKEKRATFSPKVGIDQIRPSHKTAIDNLFLAGDWTNTKLPATIEGAIQSGQECASLAGKYLSKK